MRKDKTVTRPAAIIILAAGEGTRMKSALPKVLHPIAGRTLLGHVIEAAAAAEPEHLVIVIGHGRDQVQAHIEEVAPWALTAVQEQQNGTGHAVRIALDSLHTAAPELTGPIVVLTGDTPLLTGTTVRKLVSDHGRAAAGVTMITARLNDPSGYGRVLRDVDGEVFSVVEHKDATIEQLDVDEINSGMYAFDAQELRTALTQLTTNNAQGEEYLTDVISIMRNSGRAVIGSMCPDSNEILGVNDRVQLAEAAALMRNRINESWMREGVTMADPATTWIDVDVELERDVTLLPGTVLRGPTAIATGARIGPGTTLIDCEVGIGAEVIHTWAQLAVIGDRASVGPFTYLRPGTVLGADTRAGAYVEIKNSSVGDGSKVPHLSYVGDAQIGTGSNIGAATVFVNYDGIEKHPTVVGDHVRIGSDTMLIAPVTVGDGAYTAAGSVMTEDVPPGAMAVGRAQQRNIRGWVARKRAGSSSAEAAARAESPSDTVTPDSPSPQEA